MRRGALIALAAGVLLAACGNGSGSQANSSPVATDESPNASASRGVRLKSIGHFDQPVYVTSEPGSAKSIEAKRAELAGRGTAMPIDAAMRATAQQGWGPPK